jgi:hypothetical protein
VGRSSIDRFLYRAALADLPAPVAQAITDQGGHAPGQSIVVIPPQEYLAGASGWLSALFPRWRRTPSRALMFEPARILIVEGSRAEDVRVTVIPVGALLSIELATLLLYAYAQFTWADAGQCRTLRVEFNTVGLPILDAELGRLRAAIAPPAQPVTGPQAIGDLMASLPYKFRSYLNLSRLPDEQIMAIVYQPALWRGRGPFKRALAPNRAAALTDRHLILIEDAGMRRADYTIDRRFLPRSRIRRVDFEPAAGGVWMRVRLGVSETTCDVVTPWQATAAGQLSEIMREWLPGHSPHQY